MDFHKQTELEQEEQGFKIDIDRISGDCINAFLDKHKSNNFITTVTDSLSSDDNKLLNKILTKLREQIASEFGENISELENHPENNQTKTRLMEVISKRIQMFIDNTLLALLRVMGDTPLINETLFDNKNFFISDITFTGSDFHNSGNQVLIFKCELSNGEKKKFVYKPCNIDADFSFDGQNSQVQSDKKCLLDRSNEWKKSKNKKSSSGFFSFSWGNKTTSYQQQLISTKKSIPFPHYGYMEFLTHEHGSEEHLRSVFNDMGESGEVPPKSELSHLFHLPHVCKSMQLYYNEVFCDKKIEGRDIDGDYVLDGDDPSQIRDYWVRAGFIAAFCSLCGITDLHEENVIVHNKTPHPIDLEVWNSDSDPQLFKTFLTCSPNNHTLLGSLHPTGGGPYKFRNSDLWMRKKDKEQMFFSFCDIDEKAFADGVKEAIDLAVKNKSDFNEWLLQNKGSRIRILPYPTQTLSMLEKSYTTKFVEEGSEKAHEMLQLNYRSEKIRWLQLVQRDLDQCQKEKRDPSYIPPKFVVMHPDIIGPQLSNLDVASFYGYMDETKLYTLDSEGNRTVIGAKYFDFNFDEEFEELHNEWKRQLERQESESIALEKQIKILPKLIAQLKAGEKAESIDLEGCDTLFISHIERVNGYLKIGKTDCAIKELEFELIMTKSEITSNKTSQMLTIQHINNFKNLRERVQELAECCKDGSYLQESNTSLIHKNLDNLCNKKVREKFVHDANNSLRSTMDRSLGPIVLSQRESREYPLNIPREKGLTFNSIWLTLVGLILFSE